jgi:hypothetical protein
MSRATGPHSGHQARLSNDRPVRERELPETETEPEPEAETEMEAETWIPCPAPLAALWASGATLHPSTMSAREPPETEADAGRGKRQ